MAARIKKVSFKNGSFIIVLCLISFFFFILMHTQNIQCSIRNIRAIEESNKEQEYDAIIPRHLLECSVYDANDRTSDKYAIHFLK